MMRWITIGVTFAYLLCNSQIFAANCEAKNTCGACIQDSGCVWCASQKLQSGSRCRSSSGSNSWCADSLIEPSKKDPSTNKCPCELKPQQEAEVCNYKGKLQCGACTCAPGHFGRNCECLTPPGHSDNDAEKGCRAPGQTEVCSGRGKCSCGLCECYPRDKSNERVYGQYCECDNFSCDKYEGKLCGGPGHGECICGKCRCTNGWFGPDCSCSSSTVSCITPGTNQICSDHGTCECGQCKCTPDHKNEYYGQFCQMKKKIEGQKKGFLSIFKKN